MGSDFRLIFIVTQLRNFDFFDWNVKISVEFGITIAVGTFGITSIESFLVRNFDVCPNVSQVIDNRESGGTSTCLFWTFRFHFSQSLVILNHTIASWFHGIDQRALRCSAKRIIFNYTFRGVLLSEESREF